MLSTIITYIYKFWKYECTVEIIIIIYFKFMLSNLDFIFLGKVSNWAWWIVARIKNCDIFMVNKKLW